MNNFTANMRTGSNVNMRLRKKKQINEATLKRRRNMGVILRKFQGGIVLDED